MKNASAIAVILAGIIGLASLRGETPAPPAAPAPAPSIDWVALISKLLEEVRQPTAPAEPPGLMRISLDTEKVPGQGRIRVEGDFPLIKWDTDTPHEKFENDRVAVFSLTGPTTPDFVIAATDGKVLELKRIRVGKPTPADPVKPDQPKPPVTPDPTTRATRATYVYEQRQGPVPPAVLKALSALNVPGGFVASSIDQNVISGKGQVPAQYAVVLDAAKKAGIPCLVVQAGDVVLRVVPRPTTEAQVMEAVK